MKKSIKPLRSILIILLIASMLIGTVACGKSQSGESSNGSGASSEANSDGQQSGGQNDSQSDSQGGSSEESGDNGEESGETSEPEEPEAIRELSCVSDITRIDAIAVSESGIAAIGCWEEKEIGYKHFLCVVDLKEDKILAQTEPDPDNYLGMPVGITAQDEILTMDDVLGMIRVMDRDLNLLQTIDVQADKVVFSNEEQCLYLVNYGKLTKLFLDGTEEEVIQFHNWSKIELIDPISKTLLVQGTAETEIEDMRFSVYTFDGELLYAIEGQNVFYQLADRWLVGHYFDFSNWEDTESPEPLGCYDPNNGYAATGYSIPRQLDCTGLPGTTFMAAQQDVFFSRSEGKTTLFIFDPTCGQLYTVREFDNVRRMTATRGADGLIYMTACGAGGGSILVIDPTALDMSEQLEPMDLPAASEPFVVTEVPEHLAQARAMADAIEEKYGVTILIGDQPRGTGFTGYNVTYTSELEPSEEAELVMTALETLDTGLSAYPEGFFDFFKTDDGRGGVRFSFYKSLDLMDSTFTAGGVMMMVGAWYNIAFDTRTMQPSVVHHELFHAVENRCDSENIYFDEVEWQALNPEEFSYHYELEEYWEKGFDQWILGYAEPDEAYFVRDYSMVNAKEDRATIMEFLLKDHGAINYAYEFMQTLTPIYAKLQYMGDKVQETFGYIYWKVMMEAE